MHIYMTGTFLLITNAAVMHIYNNADLVSAYFLKPFKNACVK